jgi:hypothetical protein
MRSITRRGFLAGAGATVGVLALPTLAAALPKTIAIFRLETGCGDGGCACDACKTHDANSLFPSAKAADGNRAHIGCNCVVHQGTAPYGTYIALFGQPDRLRTYRVDLRDRNTAAIVKRNPPKF